jgi:hypothetical protein
MKSVRIFLAAGFVAAAMNANAAAHAQKTIVRSSAGAHDFDFLVGEWCSNKTAGPDRANLAVSRMGSGEADRIVSFIVILTASAMNSVPRLRRTASTSSRSLAAAG